jgi:hypothetical protein
MGRGGQEQGRRVATNRGWPRRSTRSLPALRVRGCSTQLPPRAVRPLRTGRPNTGTRAAGGHGRRLRTCSALPGCGAGLPGPDPARRTHGGPTAPPATTLGVAVGGRAGSDGCCVPVPQAVEGPQSGRSEPGKTVVVRTHAAQQQQHLDKQNAAAHAVWKRGGAIATWRLTFPALHERRANKHLPRKTGSTQSLRSSPQSPVAAARTPPRCSQQCTMAVLAKNRHKRRGRCQRRCRPHAQGNGSHHWHSCRARQHHCHSHSHSHSHSNCHCRCC